MVTFKWIPLASVVGSAYQPRQQEDRELHKLIERHLEYTGSERAREILGDWDRKLPQFVQVFPKDYKRALAGVEFGEKDY